MKKIFTLCVCICFAIVTRSQAVLNEIYPQPGNGNSEFFELYNENNSLEYLDNYTIVLYYEEAGGKSGFYVLDMPNDSVAAHGYYTGASQSPFNIQGESNIAANFSWNSMPAGGSLTKWEMNGSTYTSVPVPSNLNDLFVKINGGTGGVFHAFVYKNGIIVNGIVGGINTTTVPAYIKSMPNLPVDMSGSSPDFTINFNNIANNSLEYIPNSVGTNNGYYRSSDGLCGDWLKSDMPGQHNPNLTNGMDLSLIPSNEVGIAAVVSQYPADPTKSLLTYNLVSAPAGAFPFTVEVYTDLGIAGQLDVNDQLIDTRTITSASAGGQNIILPSWDVAVIIVVKSASDCYNRTLAVGNYWTLLPVRLINFQGNLDQNNTAMLQWKVGNNEIIDQFAIERSIDGKEFKTVGIVLSNETVGTENYRFNETISSTDKIMYRLKMIGNGNEVSYSKIIVFQSKLSSGNSIKVFGNPVTDKLTFSYTTPTAQIVDIKIYDMSGKILLKNKINSPEGSNLISMPLSSTLKAGMYLLEVTNNAEKLTTKFIKQ